MLGSIHWKKQQSVLSIPVRHLDPVEHGRQTDVDRNAPSRGRLLDVIVLGGGIVGISAAVHLQQRGRQTIVIDRQGVGRGASFGNAGLIQSEAVMPYLFPRQLGEMLKYALNRSTDAFYHPSAVPKLLAPFFRYWKNSTRARALEIARARAPLILASAQDHLDLAAQAGAGDLIAQTGWSQVYGGQAALERAIESANSLKSAFEIDFNVIDAEALPGHEPALREGLAGAIYWPKPLSVGDPHALTASYAGLLERLGGVVALGNAESLRRVGTHWRVTTETGDVDGAEVVVALGAWTPELAATFGYRPPFFVKRGYHRHYAAGERGALRRPVLDAENGYMLAPMQSGIRLSTGAEFANRDAASTPVQLLRVVPLARRLVPSLGSAVDSEPWMGARPCLPDMLPVIGPVPGHPGAWFNFGHAHHGLTLAPSSGRLLAQMMTGEQPFTDPTPYRADRFLSKKIAMRHT